MARRLHRLFPFARWFPLSALTLRADVFAGLSVGLVLVPQSLAYAQLAGLPAYYGLYAAFLPPMIGALWGSSNQLATGPVAMVSILTAATLAQFAAPGSERFVALAITLALLVGVLQLTLGVLRLGAIVSFLSHPVIVGFTNAAAMIIALSQLNKLLGVSIGRGEHFLLDVWGVLEQVHETHLPTLAMGLGAIALILALRRYAPRVPGVLIAVVIGTATSWLIGFERSTEVSIEQLADADARALALEHLAGDRAIEQLNAELGARRGELRSLRAQPEHNRQHALTLDYQVQALKLEVRAQENENRLRARALRRFRLQAQGDATATAAYRSTAQPGDASAAAATVWRVQRIAGERIVLVGGGEVIGRVPQGLPSLALPPFGWDTLGLLFSSALVITLVGFMEAISIAKAIATRTRERIDPNQELIGQGLANLVGSFAQSYPVSGSFSRSAVNLGAGAVTGMASVFSALVVLATLVFLTPALYHLPQAVLAAIIFVAVTGLIDLRAIRHAWQAHRHDGICALVTLVATLAFAPHLDAGILLGGGLAIVMFLYRTMSPRVTIRFHDAQAPVLAIHFDGRLYFANVPYFEDAVLEAVASHPSARAVLVVGSGINEIDASGEEMLRHLQRRLHAGGVRVVFADLKPQAIAVLRATGLHALIGEDAFFATERDALEALVKPGKTIAVIDRVR
ncbi:MAG: STAS domain-containing protein [Burkholderiales bacterium]|nr:STAS domain-containing protein [Burkholderiales bacterium]